MRGLSEKELRVGNYIQHKGLIIEASLDVMRKCYPHQYYYEPIFLTEDWLEDLDFVKNKYGFIKGQIQVKYFTYRSNIYFRSIKDVNGNYGEWNYVATVEYIHQLQNLYFALTGNELELQKED